MLKKTTINRLGVELKSFSFDDIEFVRNLRNNPSDADFFFDNKYITKKQQIAWFNSRDEHSNFAMVAYENERRMVYCSINEISFNDKTAHNYTIMCRNKSTRVNLVTMSTFLNYIFDNLELNLVTGRIKKSNSLSISIAMKSGFLKTPGKDEHYFLTKDNFKNSLLEQFMSKFTKQNLSQLPVK